MSKTFMSAMIHLSMRYIYCLGLFYLFFLATPVSAYNPALVTVNEPFKEIVIPMDETGQQQSYLGQLETYPHLYEFTIAEATTLEMRTRQRTTRDANPINLIMLEIEPDTERIREVVRLNTPIVERTKNFDGQLGTRFFESEYISVALEPGLYRLEVSSPLNDIPYELDFGTDSTPNTYRGTFATIWTVQRHFDYWWTRYLMSTFILYHLGIVIVLSGMWYTWQRRKEMLNVD
jgi:hypothetical protein